MDTKKIFSEVIKELREDKNLTLREVAEVLEIDTSMLGKIEKGTRKPSRLLIEKIANFFNVNASDLTIIFLSDSIAYQVLDENDATKVLKMAEQKLEYLKTQQNS